jgi:glycosyltransferase involved in cell wall biosynthesis
MRAEHRIGIVVGQLSYGGAERQTALLARGMAERSSYAPAVFCLSDHVSPFAQELTKAGVQWFAPARNPARGIPKLAGLVRSLGKANCDLLYGILNVGNVYAGAAARILRLPFVGSIRSSDSGLPVAIRTLSGMFCRRADWVIANSESCRRSLRTNLGVIHGRVSVIPNAVDLPEAAPDARRRIRESLGIGSEDLVVGSLGGVKHAKRPEFFVRVFLEFRRTYGQAVHFVWVGSDDASQQTIRELMDTVPAEDRANIRFVPATTYVSDFLAAFDIFVLTSAYEGMPNALLEAMAAGLPCVATDVEGTRDVVSTSSVQGKDLCLLAPRDDPAEFARVLTELARNPQGMAALGVRAKAYVGAHFTVEKMVRSHLDVFERMFAESGRANLTRGKTPPGDPHQEGGLHEGQD